MRRILSMPAKETPATRAIAELYTCTADAAQAAPSVRRRYWLQLRDAVAELWDAAHKPGRRTLLDTDRRRELAERGVRVSATLCFAACRNATVPSSPEELEALRVLHAWTRARETIIEHCASA
jgi:plasmid stabilization system protein ParE